MIQIQIDQRVEIMRDIPELGLHCGDVGVVCSTWFAPTTLYEVEFQQDAPSFRIRALLMPSQITTAVETHDQKLAGEQTWRHN